MKRGIIAFYPYTYDTNSYHGMIQKMLSEKYCVVDYNDVKRGIVSLDILDAIYLNWLEDFLDEIDRKVISDARECEIKIFWVFHNRVSHNYLIEKKCKDNLLFLIDKANKIIILSHSSKQYLKQYLPNLNEKKVLYIPHPNYIGNYGNIVNQTLKEKIGDSQFVFGCIGTLRPDKNLELVVKAFKNMKENKNCILLIIGEPLTNEYYESLKQLTNDQPNIYLIPDRVSDYMMNFYVQLSDVLVLPYDLKTSMNSGIMLLAFTNRRTVICSNISMADEFDDSLLYKYFYKNDEQHLKLIKTQMESAYRDGKECVRRKGELLYKDVCDNNSKENVRDLLYEIVGTYSIDQENLSFKRDMIVEYDDKTAWRMRYAMMKNWMEEKLKGNPFWNRLRENSVERLAIYGYGYYGKMLYSDLKKNEIPVSCIIDQRADFIQAEIPVYTLQELEKPLDVVIVATIDVDIDQIRKKCCQLNNDCYVINLKDI